MYLIFRNVLSNPESQDDTGKSKHTRKCMNANHNGITIFDCNCSCLGICRSLSSGAAPFSITTKVTAADGAGIS
jgi:hypothetical protein